MPNRSSLLFLVLAVVFGCAAVVTARNYLAERANAAIRPPLAMVISAARDLPLGGTLEAADLELVEWPAEHQPAGAVANSQLLVGRVLARPLAEGEPVLESALLPEGAVGGLPALISPDHRAISVKVDAVVGVAGFVKPGARVDVLATLRRQNASNFSNVILQDVRVLAVDQTLGQVNDGKPRVVNVATLEVDIEEAERLVHAAHEGRLQLALRSPGDDVVVPTRSVSATDLMGRQKEVRRRGRSGPSVQILKGTSLSKEKL